MCAGVRPEAVMSDGIRPLLRTFYYAGHVPCAGALPLHIAFEPDASEVRLRGEGGAAYDVVFPEASFVEMIQRSGLKPTETLIRVWLGTIYFDPQAYPWVLRLAPSKTTAQENPARSDS